MSEVLGKFSSMDHMELHYSNMALTVFGVFILLAENRLYTQFYHSWSPIAVNVSRIIYLSVKLDKLPAPTIIHLPPLEQTQVDLLRHGAFYPALGSLRST